MRITLYRPSLTPDSKPSHAHANCNVRPSRSIALCRQLIMAMTRDPERGEEFSNTPDVVGAKMIHGILVGNQMPALKLGLRMIRACPYLLTLTHNPPIFNDENSLHIMCVNR